MLESSCHASVSQELISMHDDGIIGDNEMFVLYTYANSRMQQIGVSTIVDVLDMATQQFSGHSQVPASQGGQLTVHKGIQSVHADVNVRMNWMAMLTYAMRQANEFYWRQKRDNNVVLQIALEEYTPDTEVFDSVLTQWQSKRADPDVVRTQLNRILDLQGIPLLTAIQNMKQGIADKTDRIKQLADTSIATTEQIRTVACAADIRKQQSTTKEIHTLRNEIQSDTAVLEQAGEILHEQSGQHDTFQEAYSYLLEQYTTVQRLETQLAAYKTDVACYDTRQPSLQQCAEIEQLRTKIAQHHAAIVGHEKDILFSEAQCKRNHAGRMQLHIQFLCSQEELQENRARNEFVVLRKLFTQLIEMTQSLQTQQATLYAMQTRHEKQVELDASQQWEQCDKQIAGLQEVLEQHQFQTLQNIRNPEIFTNVCVGIGHLHGALTDMLATMQRDTAFLFDDAQQSDAQHSANYAAVQYTIEQAHKRMSLSLRNVNEVYLRHMFASDMFASAFVSDPVTSTPF